MSINLPSPEVASPTALSGEPSPSSGPAGAEAPLVIPTVFGSSALSHSSSTPLVADQRAITRLLGQIQEKSGLTVAEIARRMGVTDNGVRQYVAGNRQPGLLWFIKFCQAVDLKVGVELRRMGGG